jgi:predicted phosphodiesterase
VKLNILSDLHLSTSPLDQPRTASDVVILAGDIAKPAQAIAWAQGFGKPVVFVPGNHEFYGSSLQETVEQMKQLAHGTSVFVLDNECLVLDGMRFLGSTLWTDFLAAGPGAAQQAAIAQSVQFNRDFSRIRAVPGEHGRLLAPQDCAELFTRNTQWLKTQLSTTFSGPTVVVTHHAPSLQSVPKRFAGSPLNANFVSDAEQLVAESNAQLWVHGHLHDSFDYTLHNTRVLCNPRGYTRDGVSENAQFNPHLTVDID